MNENYPFTTAPGDIDPYGIDPDGVKKAEERKTGSKVNWFQLPAGDAISTWRILPFPKKRTFYTKVTKHWNVPGMQGSITCPRSFDDPETGKKLPCAICEKFFELNKSKEPGDQQFAKTALRSSTSYYVNAMAVKEDGTVDYEKGVGVLNLPYGVWQTLFDWMSMPKFQQFAHLVRGRNIIITSSTVAGSQIPGKPNTPKRQYSVTPDDPMPLENPDQILEKLYDLDTIVGIPTMEFTKTCLDRIITGDETLKLPDGVPAWRGQLTAGNPTPEASNTEAPPTRMSTEGFKTAALRQDNNLPPTMKDEDTPPFDGPYTQVPKFAEAATQSAIQTNASDALVCFGNFNEDEKKCLKCAKADDCETAMLKAKRAAAKAAQEAPTQEATPAPVGAPVQTVAEPQKQSVDAVRNMMMDILKKKN